jgi:peptidylprolyl isomerase
MSRPVTILLALCLAAAFVLCAGCTQSAPAAQATPAATVTTTGAAAPAATAAAGETTATMVRLETTMGNITIALDPEMPITAGNFAQLASQGYYDGVIFHRVIDGFMIQGGDPTGTGRGGPGYTIPDEFTSTNQNNRGTISMANAGANTGGSQFFINLVDNNRLDTKHPVFGTVVEGMDVVDAIGKVSTDADDRPLEDVTIIRAVVL